MTQKQSDLQRFLNGCAYYGFEPPRGYKRWTHERILKELKNLEGLYRKEKAKSLVQNTKNAANTVVQGAGESIKDVMLRAKNMAAKTGFTIKIERRKAQ